MAEGKYEEAAVICRDMLNYSRSRTELVDRLDTATAGMKLSSCMTNLGRHEESVEALTIAIEAAEALYVEEPGILPMPRSVLYRARAASYKSLGQLDLMRKDLARADETSGDITE